MAYSASGRPRMAASARGFTLMSSQTVRRPGVVTFVGVILLIQAALEATAGFGMLVFQDDVQERLASQGTAVSDGTVTTLAILALVAALLLLLAGLGLMRGSNVWRIIVVLVTGLHMVGALLTMIIQPHDAYVANGLVTLLVGTFVIWAIFGHEAADEYFEAR